MKGYIKLHRRIAENRFWLCEPFTRAQAWVDLLLLANHKDGFIRKRGIRVELKRGEVGWSERELAIRWKWSRGKVRRFLFELCSENEQKLVPQTEPQNSNVTSCYKIVNYEPYQGDGTTNGTTNSTTDGPQTGHKRYQNKNDKNDKNKTLEGFLPNWIPADLWADWKRHRTTLKAPLTERAEKLGIESLEKFRASGQDPVEIIKQSIERGWKGFFALKAQPTAPTPPPIEERDIWANE